MKVKNIIIAYFQIEENSYKNCFIKNYINKLYNKKIIIKLSLLKPPIFNDIL